MFLPPLVANRGGIYVHTYVRRSNWIERVSALLLSVSHRTMSFQFLYRKHWHRRPAAVVRCHLPPVSGPLVNLLRTIGRSIASTCTVSVGCQAAPPTLPAKPLPERDSPLNAGPLPEVSQARSVRDLPQAYVLCVHVCSVVLLLCGGCYVPRVTGPSIPKPFHQKTRGENP